ncbi:MAG: 37S ribosomal protein, mitochondrial [Sclerophora amabilis]|nr:MAG: 37S ribosomal protein, mitochondrial [Sclerophora amabilis]
MQELEEIVDFVRAEVLYPDLTTRDSLPKGMVIRQLAGRSGRLVLSLSYSRSWIRSLSSYSETGSIQASLENSRKETGAIESSINHYAPYSQPVTPVDSDNSQGDLSIVHAYHALKNHQNTTARLGTTLGPFYKPNTSLIHPPSPADVTLELLLASQAHMGHSTSLWNPANQRYIFGIRQGIHIISLDITASHLRRAAKIVSGVCERGGLVLFVGNRPGQDRCVVKAAERAGGCHLFERWIPGSITNGDQILGACRLVVVDQFDNEVEGYEEQLQEAAAIKPDLVVCLNPLENYVLLHECGLNNIPTIGIVDTDADPTWVTYPIPANDDSLRCVQLIAGVLGRAGEEGQKKRQAAAQAGRITYPQTHNLISPDEYAANKASDRQDEDVDPMHLAMENIHDE